MKRFTETSGVSDEERIGGDCAVVIRLVQRLNDL
jgi:hypothetical protein